MPTNRIVGAFSLVAAIALWLGREFIKHLFFSWAVDLVHPSVLTILEYGPPVLLAVLGLYLLSRPAIVATTAPHSAPANADKTQPQLTGAQKEGKELLGERITPEYLLGFFQEHTAIQGNQLTKAFICKWLMLNGTLDEVLCSEPKYGAQVTFQKDYAKGNWTWSDNISVFMYFDELWIEKLAILRKGDKLTVIGQINTRSTDFAASPL